METPSNNKGPGELSLPFYLAVNKAIRTAARRFDAAARTLENSNNLIEPISVRTKQQRYENVRNLKQWFELFNRVIEERTAAAETNLHPMISKKLEPFHGKGSNSELTRLRSNHQMQQKSRRRIVKELFYLFAILAREGMAESSDFDAASLNARQDYLERFRFLVTELQQQLEEEINEEESIVLPIIRTSFTRREQDALEDALRPMISPSLFPMHLAFVLKNGSIMDASSLRHDHARKLLGQQHFITRFLYKFSWRSKYEALEQKAMIPTIAAPAPATTDVTSQTPPSPPITLVITSTPPANSPQLLSPVRKLSSVIWRHYIAVIQVLTSNGQHVLTNNEVK